MVINFKNFMKYTRWDTHFFSQIINLHLVVPSVHSESESPDSSGCSGVCIHEPGSFSIFGKNLQLNKVFKTVTKRQVS